MSQKGNKIGDSLEFVTVGRFNGKGNKGKTYAKDENKNNIVTYFKIDKKGKEQLKEYAKTTGLSQSKVIKDALIYYFNH